MKRNKPLTYRVMFKNSTAEYPLIDSNSNLNEKTVELVLHLEKKVYPCCWANFKKVNSINECYLVK